MSKGNILIVDDELAICTSLVTLLKDGGYAASYAQSAKEALQLVKQACFDTLFVDINMPETDGISLLKQIKELDKTMPVVIITAFPSNQTIDESMKLRAYDYITKPFKPEKIYFTAERAVSYGKTLRKIKKPQAT